MGFITHNLNIIVTILLLVGMSLALRLLLQIMGQTWIKTVAHTATLTLLPILTYIITTVISGNIALSLGMVGALSIVRFRNPVRSPLELSVYFGAITMGIAAAVGMKWLILLLGSVLFVAIALHSANTIWKMVFKTPFFTASFSEGNSMSTLDITANAAVAALDQSRDLISKRREQGTVSYTLASQNFETLSQVEKSLNDDESVIATQLNR